MILFILLHLMMFCLIKFIHVFSVDAKRASFIKCNMIRTQLSSLLSLRPTDTCWDELSVVEKCWFEVAHEWIEVLY